MVSAYDQLKGLHIDDEGIIAEIDIQEMRNQLGQLSEKEFQHSLHASEVEILNQRTGKSQLILNYLIARFLFNFRRKMRQGEDNFWAEVRAQEQILQDKEAISISFPKNIAQRLYGLPFNIQIPQVGEKATLLAPIPLIQSSLDSVCSLASKMHRSRADLSTEEVLTRIDREIDKLLIDK